jgi:hypothetical protein
MSFSEATQDLSARGFIWSLIFMADVELDSWCIYLIIAGHREDVLKITSLAVHKNDYQGVNMKGMLSA